MREDKIIKEAVKSNIDNIKKTANAFKDGYKGHKIGSDFVMQGHEEPTILKASYKAGQGAKKVTDVTNNKVVKPVKDKVVKPVKEFNETAGGSMLIGGAIGTLSGAGVGGIGAAATGGDEDDVKAAIATGAMIGGGVGVIGGAIKGGVKLKKLKTDEEAAKVAENISKAGADGKPVS